QTVEINRGSECGVRVGMPVLNAAGLIGKVTAVFNKRAVVMLITDPGYSLAVKVVNVPPTTTTTTVPGQEPDETPATTSTSTTTTVPRTTTTVGIPGFTPGSTVPVATTTTAAGATPPASGPNQPAQATKSPITVPPGADLPLRETGALEGRGLSKTPVVRFVENESRFGDVAIGSPVVTAGGATSLAPPDIVVGTVSKIVRRPGTLGPLLEVQLSANLDYLNFVRILLYRPGTEKNSP
ncbi:MAG: putative rod shape-determining protein MreC, partial [Actinomycetota bacterium]